MSVYMCLIAYVFIWIEISGFFSPEGYFSRF